MLALLLVLLVLAPGLAQEHAPRPYTARQIREAMPVGFQCTYATPRGEERWTVLRSTEDEVEIRYTTADGQSQTGVHTWTELRNHATFPAEATTITDVVHTVPAGTFECWLYTVRTEQGERRFYFAKEKPGAPIEYGTQSDRTVLIELK